MDQYYPPPIPPMLPSRAAVGGRRRPPAHLYFLLLLTLLLPLLPLLLGIGPAPAGATTIMGDTSKCNLITKGPTVEGTVRRLDVARIAMPVAKGIEVTDGSELRVDLGMSKGENANSKTVTPALLRGKPLGCTLSCPPTVNRDNWISDWNHPSVEVRFLFAACVCGRVCVTRRAVHHTQAPGTYRSALLYYLTYSRPFVVFTVFLAHHHLHAVCCHRERIRGHSHSHRPFHKRMGAEPGIYVHRERVLRPRRQAGADCMRGRHCQIKQRR